MRSIGVSAAMFGVFLLVFGVGLSASWGWVVPVLFPKMVSDGYVSAKMPVSIGCFLVLMLLLTKVFFVSLSNSVFKKEE